MLIPATGGVLFKQYTIVHAAAAPLPELYAVGHYAVSAPMGGPGYVDVGKFLFVAGIVHIEHIAVGYLPALGRCPSTYAAAGRAGLKIGVAFALVNLFNKALYTHLALQLFPEKNEGSMGVGINFAALVAVVIGEENKAACIQALQQDYAGVGLHTGIDSGQCHGIDLGDPGGGRFVKPFTKKMQINIL